MASLAAMFVAAGIIHQLPILNAGCTVVSLAGPVESEGTRRRGQGRGHHCCMPPGASARLCLKACQSVNCCHEAERRVLNFCRAVRSLPPSVVVSSAATAVAGCNICKLARG